MIDIAGLTSLQAKLVELWHQDSIHNDWHDFEALAVLNHEINFRLWHEEDQARDPRATDSVIAGVKRAIDRLNQQRADSIEQMDNEIENQLQKCGVGVPASGRADQALPLNDQVLPVNTETLGSVIDRLSILSLRIFHLAEQQQRANLDADLRARVGQSWAIAVQQRANLTRAATELVEDLFAGRKRHVTFRQLKMYNDPNLNPAIYQWTEAKSEKRQR